MKAFHEDLICSNSVQALLAELRRHDIAGPLYAQLLSTDKKRFMMAAYLEEVPFTPRSKQGKAANVNRRKLLRMAEKVVEPLRTQLQVQMNKHVVVVVNILVSLPGAGAQEVHLDFSEDVLTSLDVSEIPFSILLPLHDYCLFNLQLHGKYDTITPVTIPYGMYIQFRGDLWHFGGINPLSIVQYRIHAYFATSLDIIPKDAVFK